MVGDLVKVIEVGFKELTKDLSSGENSWNANNYNWNGNHKHQAPNDF